MHKMYQSLTENDDGFGWNLEYVCFYSMHCGLKYSLYFPSEPFKTASNSEFPKKLVADSKVHYETILQV